MQELGGNWQLIPRHCIREWDFLVWDSQEESSGRPAADATAPCCSSQMWKGSRGEVTGSSTRTRSALGNSQEAFARGRQMPAQVPHLLSPVKVRHCHLTEEKETSTRNKKPQNKTQNTPYLGKEMYFIGKKKLHFTYTPWKYWVVSYFHKKRLRLSQENHILYCSVTPWDEALVASALGFFTKQYSRTKCALGKNPKYWPLPDATPHWRHGIHLVNSWIISELETSLKFSLLT